MGVYVLCGCCPGKPNAHYIGFTNRDWMDRLREHQSGAGCKYTSRHQKEGYIWRLAHWWPEFTLTHEYRLKSLCRSKAALNIKRWCPRCGSGNIPSEVDILFAPKRRTTRRVTRSDGSVGL